MEFVQNFTPPDFQAKNFTPSLSPNFNSFRYKNTKNEWKWWNLHLWQEIYIHTGSDGTNLTSVLWSHNFLHLIALFKWKWCQNLMMPKKVCNTSIPRKNRIYSSGINDPWKSLFETTKSFLGDGHCLKLFFGVWVSSVHRYREIRTLLLCCSIIFNNSTPFFYNASFLLCLFGGGGMLSRFVRFLSIIKLALMCQNYCANNFAMFLFTSTTIYII